MVTTDPQLVLDEIASAVVLADVCDPDSFATLDALVSKLAAALPQAEGNWRRVVESWHEELARIRAAKDEDEAAGYAASLVAKVAEFQRAFQGLNGDGPVTLPEDSAPRDSTASFSQPMWVDTEVLREFLDNQHVLMEEMEGQILGLEDGDGGRLELRGTIHSLKGEAGILGLDDLAAVCHAVEDVLDQVADGGGLTDVLLHVKDWIAGALESYTGRRLPEPRAPVIEALIRTFAAGVDAAPMAEPTVDVASGRGGDVGNDGITADSEMMELLGDFLEESDEGLDRADHILIAVESDGADASAVHGLFRVFHTMKGMAALLGIRHVAELAHVAENLLNLVRGGGVELAGEALELVFEATALQRRLLDEVRECPHGTPSEEVERCWGGLLERLQVVVDESSTSGMSTPPVTNGNGGIAPTIASDTLAAEAERGDPTRPRARLRETVKVYVDRLDQLVEMVGELVIVESMIANSPEITALESRRVRGYFGQLGRITSTLQDVGMSMRMVPVRGLFQKMSRLVRDVSAKSGKKVRLVVAGETTEIDRSIVEGLADPLMHMIRNAVGHGIEPPKQRLQLGKSDEGTVWLSARTEGGSIVIEVADDGQGIDRDAIVDRACELGMIDQNAELSDGEILNLVFLPGMSTAREITEVSGRGVGMDVVKRSVSQLRGRISVHSLPGEGTRFQIVLPLTLAIIDGMVVTVGNERYIIPTLSIVESIQVAPSMRTNIFDRGEVVNVRGECLPLLRLAELLGVEGPVKDVSEGLVVVLEGVGQRAAVLVDDVITQQQVVIKSLASGLGASRLMSGAAIMSDGSVGLIINVDEIGALSRNVAAEAFSKTRQRDGERSGPGASEPSGTAAGHRRGARNEGGVEHE